MKISSLLEIDCKFNCSESVADSFGDSFLFKNNKIFHGIRSKALACGYIPSSAFNASYLALPLSQLSEVLQKKQLPYVDNVSVLKAIENRIPKSTNWDEVVDNLKRNYLFHESCHAIAHSLSSKIFPNTLEKSANIVRLFIEESFANSCELLGIIYAEDAAHRIFYEANSYIFMLDSRPHLKKLVAEIGLEQSLRYFVLCYLHSNFLFDNLDDRQFQSVLQMTKAEQKTKQDFTSAQLKSLKMLSRNAFELNPRFRETTSGFYLRLMGLSCSHQELKKIDFIKLIKTDGNLALLLNSLCETFRD